MTAQITSSTSDDTQRRPLWRIAWVILAVVYAAPVGYFAYDQIAEVTRKAREELIVRHRLWELDTTYQGSPQMWTRVAVRLLTDNQLMRRVRARYGDLAREIELDYRRDLTMAQGEVVAVAACVWALPLVALYGIALVAVRRRRPPLPPPRAPAAPASSDSRYRP